MTPAGKQRKKAAIKGRSGGNISVVYRQSQKGSHKLHALSSFLSEQIGNPPKNVIFHFVAHAVGIDNVPQHTHQLQPLLVVQPPFEFRGEAIIIDRLVFRP